MDDDLNFYRSSYCSNSCCLEVAIEPQTGKIYVRNSKVPGAQLEFSPLEWRAFVAGVKSNEFDL
jgi:Domain of unknown function (DUF397)